MCHFDLEDLSHSFEKKISPLVRCAGMHKCRERMDAQERRNDIS